jgi:hypothetical protein
MSAVFHDYIPLWAGDPTDATLGLDMASLADVAVIPVPYKCQVRRVALLYTTTGTAAAAVEFDQRVLAGSDTGRVNFATVSKGASNQQGKYIYEDPATSVVLNEGDEIVVQVTDVEASAKAWAIVLIERMPEVPANQADMVAG